MSSPMLQASKNFIKNFSFNIIFNHKCYTDSLDPNCA